MDFIFSIVLIDDDKNKLMEAAGAMEIEKEAFPEFFRV